MSGDTVVRLKLSGSQNRLVVHPVVPRVRVRVQSHQQVIRPKVVVGGPRGPQGEPGEPGPSGATDQLNNSDGSVLKLTLVDSPFGQAILHIPPGVEVDTNFLAAHNLTFAAGAGVDGRGAYLPEIQLSETGGINIVTNNPGTSGNNRLNIIAEDGFSFSKDGSSVGTFRTDDFTSGHTYQLPDSDGTIAVTEDVEDKTFTQDFNSTSVVSVNHNLGKRPSVTVIDSAGDECEGNVVHNSNNSLTVSFSAPFSGTVICN